jgi:hypothetical protein
LPQAEPTATQLAAVLLAAPVSQQPTVHVLPEQQGWPG